MRNIRVILTFFVLIASCIVGRGYDHTYIAQHNIPAVVQVNVLDKNGGTFTGTGFVLSAEGLLVTNQHIVQNALYVNVTFSNGVTSGEAAIFALSPEHDLALLKIEAQHLPHVTLAPKEEVLPGQTITVIGNPRRLQNTVTSGIISQLRKQPDGTLWHQISAPISPSSSGSPVFNEQGEVISIAFASVQGAGNQNLNFAIPVRYVKELMETAQISLAPTQEQNTHPFVRHVQKSWQISKQLFRQWFGGE